jgi:hypothetical protein
VHETSTGLPVVAYPSPRPGAFTASFSPDSTAVRLYRGDGVIETWPLDLLSAARKMCPRDLTPDERDLYEVGTPEERAGRRLLWNAQGALR